MLDFWAVYVEVKSTVSVFLISRAAYVVFYSCGCDRQKSLKHLFKINL